MTKLQEYMDKELFLIWILVLLFPAFRSARADTDTFPERKKEVIRAYIEYEWWLLTWAENEFACNVMVEHEGFPYFDEIYQHCGPDVLSTWIEHPLCPEAP